MRLFACLTGLVAALIASPAMAAEEPAYSLVERDGPIEIRDYAPQIIAEVVVEGDRRQASGRGFRPLAGYIFGDNQPREEIADGIAIVIDALGGFILAGRNEVAVLRIEHEDEAQEDGEQAFVDMLRVLVGELAHHLARLDADREAAHQRIERAENLFGQFGRDRVLMLTRAFEDAVEAAFPAAPDRIATKKQFQPAKHGSAGGRRHGVEIGTHVRVF